MEEMAGPSQKSLPWYKEGLRFQCTGCGGCCTGSPGFVWVGEEEINALSNLLQITPQEFIRTYTKKVGFRLSLLEHPRTFDCVFLKGKQCQVYSARPKQCRTFPWWEDHLHSKEAWKEAIDRCEGIDHADAPLVPFEEIQKELNRSNM
jgi:Fe-S-cluster containining protein